jgi:lipopolysaccharide/colanic/teichoic acid biosynthesis glycosyltransferase
LRPDSQRKPAAPARLQTAWPPPRRGSASKRALDVVVAAALLVVLTPLGLVIAAAIKIDSRGPVFYRSRRAGLRGAEFAMLKFRKMYNGAEGPALTAADDARFTRVGRLLARTKLDEIPQLLNVLRGEMSLVGPRPEDPDFVRLAPADFATVLAVRPGITGLSQLAFARESEILDPSDRVGHYVRRILPQKLTLDTLYSTRRSTRMDVTILAWTLFAVVARRDVAVNRVTGMLTPRRRKPLRRETVEPSQAA